MKFNVKYTSRFKKDYKRLILSRGCGGGAGNLVEYQHRKEF